MKTKSKSNPDPAAGKKTSLLILLEAAGVRLEKIQNPDHAHLWSLPKPWCKCFTLSVSVALNVQFITNGMWVKNHTHIYMAGARRNTMPVFMVHYVISIVACCQCQKWVDSVFLTPHLILFGKFWIRIQCDFATTMMQVIRLLFDSASIKVMHIPHNIN